MDEETIKCLYKISTLIRSLMQRNNDYDSDRARWELNDINYVQEYLLEKMEG